MISRPESGSLFRSEHFPSPREKENFSKKESEEQLIQIQYLSSFYCIFMKKQALFSNNQWPFFPFFVCFLQLFQLFYCICSCKFTTYQEDVKATFYDHKVYNPPHSYPQHYKKLYNMHNLYIIITIFLHFSNFPIISRDFQFANCEI